METGANESLQNKSVADHVGKSMWSKLKEAFIDMPIAEKAAENIVVINNQLTAPSLNTVRHLLQKHGHTIAKGIEVTATALDITLAVTCAALGIGKIKKLGTPEQRAEAKKVLTGHTLLEKNTSSLYVNHMKRNAMMLGGTGAAILVLRPVSRLALVGGTVMKPLSEKVGQIVNRIAGGSRETMSASG